MTQFDKQWWEAAATKRSVDVLGETPNTTGQRPVPPRARTRTAEFRRGAEMDTRGRV
jgi:hypothetical protein